MNDTSSSIDPLQSSSTSGVGACARDGQARCEGGALGCSAIAASPNGEQCNTVDDDCDGTVDDEVQFTAERLDGGNIFEDGGCSVGVGACRANGVALCTSGAVGCSAVALDAGVEQCNGVDDDCDGATDELPGTLCGSGGQTCLSGACGCTGGRSVCGSGCAVLGGTCTAGVGACLRTGTLVCSAPTSSAQCSVTAGTPSTEVCDGVDNDCDGTTDEALRVVCHPDPDGDNVPTTTTAPQSRCRDSARAAFGYCPSGYTAYFAEPDCAPNDASAWRLASTGLDSDNDSHCAPNSVGMRCFGATIPAPYKQSGACLDASDCNDAQPDRYRNVSVRTDGDNDFYCVGGAYIACIGAIGNGVRPTTECRGEDCKDDNGYATATCRYPGFRTLPSNKRCDIGVPPSETINAFPNYTCGAGFGIVDVMSVRTSPAGACAPAGTTAIHMGCNGVGIGTVTCYLDGWCQAL